MAMKRWPGKGLEATLCSCLAFSCGLATQVSSPAQCAPQRLTSDPGRGGTTWVPLPSEVWAVMGSPESFHVRPVCFLGLLFLLCETGPSATCLAGGLEDYRRQRVPSAWALAAVGWRRPVAFLGCLWAIPRRHAGIRIRSRKMGVSWKGEGL